MENEEKMTFEAKLNRLNEIVSKIEGQTLPLQETLSLYKEGKALIEDLQKALSEAEPNLGDLRADEEDIQ